MISIAALRALATAGATAEIIIAAVEADIIEETTKLTAKREKSAERQRRSREARHAMSRDVTHVPVTGCDTPSPPSFPPSMVSLNNPSLTTPQSPPSSPEALASLAWSFEEFWRIYPHKIGKRDALKAFDVAKRSEFPFEGVKEALQRYIREKPPDRPYCNPATWLRQGRWDDQPAPQTNGVGNGPSENPHSVVAAGQRLLDKIRSWDDPAEGNSTGGGARGPPVRLLSKG